MKSSTRLESAVFHLTPTRTRCDLVILANGKTEKIASGLLNPFLAHLKTAQDQMAKGGYSIILEPDSSNGATWFIKETVERFVRFVSTPEVLERVYTIESEILQIEEAVTMQGNNDIGLSAVDDHQSKSVESIEGSRPLPDPNEEKAIVLYKPGAHPPEANGSTLQEGNSKVQLLRVLETRKTVLQKEQGMAFARAVAAGFDIDHMAPLMSFAESFGASRLMDACVRFMDLWKRKHETGQWLEIEAAEALSTRSDISSMNASGIVLSNVVNKQKEIREAWPDTSENNGKANIHTSTGEKPPTDYQSTAHQEYFQGHFPHPMFPSWPIHSPPGALSVFQGYPMQGMPYYQNYPNSPFFQPPYPVVENPTLNADQRMRQKRHSMDSKDMESETWEMEKARSQDDMEMGKETSQSREQRKVSSRSGRKQSGTVVIQNINYITSKKQNSSDSDSHSASSSETDEEDEDLHNNSPKMQYKKSLRSSKGKESRTKSMDTLNSFDKERLADGTEPDSGHWQAFQSYLLRDADKEEKAIEQGMFAMEKEIRVKRRPNAVGDDPLVYAGRDMSQYQEGNIIDMQNVTGSMTRMLKESNDGSLISRRVDQRGDGRIFMDVQSTEIDGRRVAYRSENDGFMIHKRENRSGFTNSSDPRAVNGFEHASNGLDKRPSHNMDDDSYIISLRSVSLDDVGADGRNAIDMDSELPSSQRKAENISNRVGSQVHYEPDDLSLMPERGTEKKSIGYDVALDYEMQVHAGDSASLDQKSKDVVTHIKQGAKKSEKDRKLKLASDASDKKKVLGPIRKGRPSKLSPLDEARARAERLRNFKADLQKMKKEKEEEEMRRLEALKIARQKRIAARGSSITAQSSSSSHQTRKQLPTKHSPLSHKGSKFSDSEPASSSPLQKISIRATSLGSNDSQKPFKPRKMNTGSHSAGSRLSQSVSSLPEPKKQSSAMPDTKASISQIRRLSEPKISSSGRVSSVKAQSTEPSSKRKISDGPESKKIYAIVNHDRSKAASLPELRIRTSKGPDIAHEISAANEMMQEESGNKSSNTEIELNRNKDKISHHSDGDDSTVIEKTVVMLECEKPSIPAIQTSEENMGLEKGHYDNHKIGENPEVVSGYATIRAPVSPSTMEGVDRESIEHQLQRQANAYDIGLVTIENRSNTGKESPKFSSPSVAEKSYQAPYARVSSLEDPCTRNSEYGRALPASTQIDTKERETVKGLLSDSKSLQLEKIPEALDKPQIKESSKGIRRLLKFGRKTHGSATGERNVESDNVSVNGSEADELVANTAASSEVYTLKNLISQDETPPAAATPQKSSRHFPLLSPFRSKTGEKKLTT